MKTFYDSCKHCLFIWSVNERLPIYCPECGTALYKDTAELLLASKKFVVYEDLKKI